MTALASISSDVIRRPCWVRVCAFLHGRVQSCSNMMGWVGMTQFTSPSLPFQTDSHPSPCSSESISSNLALLANRSFSSERRFTLKANSACLSILRPASILQRGLYGLIGQGCLIHHICFCHGVLIAREQ